MAELETKLTLTGLQPPTQQLQLPEGANAPRQQLDLKPAPFTKEASHKSFRGVEASQP
jgi:hypothetical protein